MYKLDHISGLLETSGPYEYLKKNIFIVFYIFKTSPHLLLLFYEKVANTVLP